MKIYGDHQSGNCYKVALMASLVDAKHEWVNIDIIAGDTQTQSFLKKSPIGKIPLLELDNGDVLSESNAIINYLAFDSPFYSHDPIIQAQILQWQFFEQYSHEPYIAVARFINKYLGLPDDKKAEFDAKQAGGNKALSVMEQQLEQSLFLVANRLTVADISLFAYTHVANEGGFNLTRYPAINRWIDRIKQHPKFIAMS